MRRVLIIGGGFFGMFIAEHLAAQGHDVSLMERDSEFMQRASYVNQARVHNGYHYPRSVLTALRSRVSFPRFVREFNGCIDSSFEKYYMVGKLLGKVTAKQFHQFCERIGASCEPAASKITRLVNPDLIEAVYVAEESAFDASRLLLIMKDRLVGRRVKCMMSTEVRKVELRDGRLAVTACHSDGPVEVIDGFDHVFNCTYSMINNLTRGSGLETIPLKHELAEICLVDVPDVIKNYGITVMCGPFFSCMPFPARASHSFTHVRYTPHFDWHDTASERTGLTSYQRMSHADRRSAWGAMWRDAARYMPVLSEARYKESLWEVKTVLPRSESDDSRPILFRTNHGLRGFHCIMGGKIDNVYDAVAQIDKLDLLNQAL